MPWPFAFSLLRIFVRPMLFVDGCNALSQFAQPASLAHSHRARPMPMAKYARKMISKLLIDQVLGVEDEYGPRLVLRHWPRPWGKERSHDARWLPPSRFGRAGVLALWGLLACIC